MKINFKIKYLYWILLLAILFFFNSRNLFNSDEGVILEGAWNIINGKELYSDFFEFVTPGSFYMIYGLWKIFSPTYLVAKLFSLFLFWLTALGIFKISSLFKKTPTNYIPPLIFVCTSFFGPIINHNTHNLFFLTFATYFYLKGLMQKGNINFVYAGLLASLSFLFLQQKGIVLIISLTGYLLLLSIIEKNKKRLKQSLLFFSSAIIPSLSIFFKWPADLLYRSIFEFAITNYVEFNKMPFGIFLFFLILTTIVAIILGNKKSKRIIFLLLLQIGFLLTTLARPDHYHVLLIIFPLYSLFPQIIEKISRIKHWTKYVYYSLCATVIFMIISPSLLFVTLNPPSFTNSKLNEVVEYIKKNCPKQNDLFAGPFLPGLYFEAKKVNFTPYYLLMTGLQGENKFFEVKKLLEKNQPECIVMNYQIGDKFNYSKDNPVDNYIKNKYTLQKIINNDYIFRKNNIPLCTYP